MLSGFLYIRNGEPPSTKVSGCGCVGPSMRLISFYQFRGVTEGLTDSISYAIFER